MAKVHQSFEDTILNILGLKAREVSYIRIELYPGDVAKVTVCVLAIDDVGKIINNWMERKWEMKEILG